MMLEKNTAQQIQKPAAEKWQQGRLRMKLLPGLRINKIGSSGRVRTETLWRGFNYVKKALHPVQRDSRDKEGWC